MNRPRQYQLANLPLFEGVGTDLRWVMELRRKVYREKKTFFDNTHIIIFLGRYIKITSPLPPDFGSEIMFES